MRRVILPAILALIAAPATAQTTIGLRGGIGLATVVIDEEDVDPEYRGGIMAGVDLTIPVSGFLGFRFSGVYAEKGTDVTLEEGMETTGIALDLTQAQLSLLARIGTPSTGGVSMGVMAGPWAAYQISCDVEASSAGINFSSSCAEANFEFEEIDYGVAFGAGAEFPVVAGIRLGVDAIYSLGLASLDEGETRTRHLAVLGGIVIPIG